MKQKVYQQVAQILTEYPRARDDDNFLIALVYRNFYGVGAASFFDVMSNWHWLALPSPESITRYRRRLQEEAPLIYGASGQTRKERAKEEELYRERFRRT